MDTVYASLRTIARRKARHFSCAALVACLFFIPCARAQQPAPRDFSKEAARPVREWVRDGVIYEIFPRAFSAEGNFNGVTARLDQLKDLGVTILWLMPIHPTGQEKKKGTVGSPYAVRDYYAINHRLRHEGGLETARRGGSPARA